REEQAGLEKEIRCAETDVAHHEKLLSDPDQYGDYNRLQALNRDLNAAQKRLARLLGRWEEVSLELEQVQGGGQQH
ncbi:MAG: hypothetical protein GX881_08315, partial [Firmicutes bacterium]|nr:hypothetical protein [Bacillota bacterium]